MEKGRCSFSSVSPTAPEVLKQPGHMKRISTERRLELTCKACSPQGSAGKGTLYQMSPRYFSPRCQCTGVKQGLQHAKGQTVWESTVYHDRGGVVDFFVTGSAAGIPHVTVEPETKNPGENQKSSSKTHIGWLPVPYIHSKGSTISS